MGRPSLQSAWSRVFHRQFRTHASLFTVLCCAVGLWIVVPGAVDSTAEFLAIRLEAQALGALVYTTTGLGVTAAIYFLIRRRTGDRDTPTTLTLVQYAGVLGVSLAAGTYLLHGLLPLPVLPISSITAAIVGPVGMGGLAIGYARLYGLRLRLDRPGAATLRPTGLAMGLAALAGIGSTGYVFIWADATNHLSITATVSEEGAVDRLLARIVVPGLLTGIGWGVFFNGAIQERFRTIGGVTRSVALTVPIIGVTASIGGFIPLATTPLLTAAAVGVVAGMAILAAFVSNRAVETLAGTAPTQGRPVLAAVVGTAVVAATLALVTVATGSPMAAVPIYGISGLVGALVCLGYVTTRSAWVASLVLATYFICSDLVFLFITLQ